MYEEIKELLDFENFSSVVQEALNEYMEKKKIEKFMSLVGSLKDWEIEDGVEFVSKIRRKDIGIKPFQENFREK